MPTSHNLSPIALFAFNRPKHLQQTLTALAANELAAESELYIFCDGPRTEKEKTLTDAVRSVAHSASGFSSIRVIAKETNLGCANSVIRGVSELFKAHPRLIVIEDDILCSPHTLSFLNTSLEKYERTTTVFNIAAWSPPSRILPISSHYPFDVYAIPRFNCCGWATWKDRWEKIDWNLHDYTLFSQTPELQKAFNQGGQDLSPMLKLQIEKKIDSWAIRMDYTRFKHGCLGINPVRSYTTNIGMGSGTHTIHATTRFDNDISLGVPTAQLRLPEHIFVDQNVLKAYQNVYALPPLILRAINKAWRTIFKKNLLDI